MPPAPDEHILHYRITRSLGAGGMGEVYLAQDERLGRHVALKFLPRADSTDPERRERLRREARALAALSHPGIAAIYALEEHGDRLFLVMEFIEGETLAQRLERRPLPVDELIERGRVLADALAHAHGRGVIHRDVKPSNILITPDGATKLADFGLALHEGDTRLTAEGSTAGTAEHMSPEQTRGEPLDKRSDIFSLGVVLYEALTGKRPFSRPTLEATFHAIRSEQPEPPTALRSGIPLELERIIMKCIRKEPADRYQHADEIASDLRALRATTVASTSVSGAPSGPSGSSGRAGTATAPAPGAPPRRSRKLLLLIPAILLVAALAYLFGGLRPQQGGEAQAAERSIAVLSFQNMQDPADPRREAAMAASLLNVGLGESQVIPVVGAQRVQDVLRQMGKADRPLSGADALDVGRRAGATYIVTGYVYQTTPDVVLAAEVASTANGAVLTSRRVRVPGGEQGMFAAIDSLTAALRDGLAQAGFGVKQKPVDIAELTTRSPAAYRAYTRGLDMLYRGDMQDAAGAFRGAVAADSTFALAWYHLAVAGWWAHDNAEAQRNVQTALRSGHRLAARDKDALRALATLIAGDYPSAANQYRALAQRYPDDKELHYGLGEALFHSEDDLDGARAALDRAIALDSTFAVAYMHVIDIDVMREDLPRARADAQRFRQADPTNPIPQGLEMSAQGRLGDAEGALQTSREVLARHPESGDAQRMHFILLELTSHPDSARALLDHVVASGIRIDPADLAYARAWLAVSEGRFRDAERETARFRAGTSRTHAAEMAAPILELRARALVQLGRNDEAMAVARQQRDAIRRILPVGSNGGMIPYTRWALRVGRTAEAKQALREFERSMAREDTRISRNTRDYLAATIALAEGRAQEAVRLMKNGQPAGPPFRRNADRRWLLARALIAAGDRDRAVPELQAVVARAPYASDPDMLFQSMVVLAKEYERLDRKDEALALYRRVADQYVHADPGVAANEEAKAAIARMERARAQAASD
jgi:tetratricopeptide (TPR) repeat protein/predicted Ser/Thr protein kinase